VEECGGEAAASVFAAHDEAGDGPHVGVVEGFGGGGDDVAGACEADLRCAGSDARPPCGLLVEVGDDAGRRAGVDFGVQPVASLVGAAAVELWVGVRPPGALAAGAVTAAREGALQVVPAFGGGDVGGDGGHGVTLGASA